MSKCGMFVSAAAWFFYAQTTFAAEQRVLWREPHTLELGSRAEHRFFVDACLELRIGILLEGAPFSARLADPIEVVLLEPSGEPVIPEGSETAIAQPAPGEWRIRVSGRPSQEHAVTYALTAVLAEPFYRFDILSEPGKYMAGRPLPIRARVSYKEAPVSDVPVEVTVWEDDADGAPFIRLLLSDDGEDGDAQAGDGIYETVVVPQQAGRHTARFLVEENETFRRVGELVFEVVDQGVDLRAVVEAKRIDAQDSRTSEALQLTVEVEVIDTEETYTVAAQLYDAQERVVGAEPEGFDAEVPKPDLLREHARRVVLPQESGVHKIEFVFHVDAFRSEGPYRLELVAAAGEASPDSEVTGTVRADFVVPGYDW